jgi:hypothetical protein
MLPPAAAKEAAMLVASSMSSSPAISCITSLNGLSSQTLVVSGGWLAPDAVCLFTQAPHPCIAGLQVVREMSRDSSLRTAVLVGGDAMEAQFAELAHNPDVIVATPGGHKPMLWCQVEAS